LQLRFAILVFDEAIYSKVQQIRWKNDVFYNRFVVRLGEFHVIMSFLSSVARIFQDGGLKVYVILNHDDKYHEEIADTKSFIFISFLK
jgi:hypothetical protein